MSKQVARFCTIGASFVMLFTLYGCAVSTDEILVENQNAYIEALKNVQPGGTIKLADGVWEDFEILFTGIGTAEKPITLTAQTKGKVILSGQSNLRLAGEHLIVSGLVFKDGYTPTSEVVSFRRNNEELANNSRITEVVIDNYNQPERYEVDFWVLMYGKNNRFDHNHLVGKRNKGVTMAVRLNTIDSQENHHRIDHNYFGPRPILGSNGGETLRIGTSHYSRTNSFTIVENNYFDRSDGELEIISNKSGRNTFRNNTFYQSRGTLTMRHGNNNLVEGNVFFGNGADHTGGIRVINGGQTILNNYMEGLKGTRFGGAFVVMNGVPNSPINRYDQVKDANISRNTIVNSDNIQLAAGSDAERSAAPVDSRFANNLIFNADGRDTFTIYDDVSGIDFSDNIIGRAAPNSLGYGFKVMDINMSRAENSLLYPEDNGIENVGVSRDLKPTSKDATGVDWYPKAEPLIAFSSGQTIEVQPEEGALFNAVQAAKAGDILLLVPGHYVVSKFLKLDKPLTFKGADDVHISYERSTLFQIEDGGSLQLINLNISGADAPDNAGNSVIRTSPYAMLQNYRLEIIDTSFSDLDVNHSFNVMTVAKGTFADQILVRNSTFADVTGAVFKLDKESDDFGIYNAEYLTIGNSTFDNIKGALVDFYRGGTDESTFGPHFSLQNSTLSNVGSGKRNKSKSSMQLHGVQVTDMSGNIFKDSRPFLINHTVGEPKTRITKNKFVATPAPLVSELNSGLAPTAVLQDNEGINP